MAWRRRDAYGLLVAVSAATMLVAAPLWGAASDRVGRRPVLAVGLFGLGAALVAFALAKSLGALLAARAASGILSAAAQPAALAYVADRTGEEERDGAIGRLTGTLALGVVVGPGIGGLLAERSAILPFAIGAALAVLSAVLVLLLLPEARPLERRADPATGRRAAADVGGRLWGMLALIVVATLGTSCFQAVFGLDAVRRLAMSPGRIGLMLVLIAASGALMQGLACGPLSRALGDAAVARLSFAGGVAGFVVLAAARSAGAYLAATAAYVLTHTLLRPSLQTLASTEAGARQGKALGLANAAQGLGATVGPLAAGPLLDVAPVWPYALGAAVLAAGLAVSFVVIGKGEKT